MAKQSTDNNIIATCTLCLEVCIEPKVLPCCHTFCKKCLEGILDQSESKEKLACPQCRAEHQVPSSGPDGFQNDYTLPVRQIKRKRSLKVDTSELCDDQGTAVCFCTECSAHLCDSCTNVHKKIKLLKSHEVVSLDSDGVQFGRDKLKVLFCSQHPDKSLDAYCQACQCVVCVRCIIDSHNGHHLIEIDSKLRKAVQKQIEELVVEVQTKLTDLEANHKYISDVEKGIMDEPIPIKAEINKVFDSLVTQLEAQRLVLLEKVEASSNEDLMELWAQKEHVEKTITGLRGTLSFTERYLQSSHDLEFLALGSQVMACLKELKEMNWDSSGTDLINRTIRKVRFRKIMVLNVGKLEEVTMKDDLLVFCEMPPSAELGQRFEFKVGCRMSKSKRRQKVQFEYFDVHILHGKWKIEIPHPPEVCADPSGQSWSVAFVPVVSGDHIVKVKLGTHLDEEVRREAVVSVTGEPAVDQVVQLGPDWQYDDMKKDTVSRQGRVVLFERGETMNVTARWNKNDGYIDLKYKWGTDDGCYDVQLVV